ncbi:MAG: glycosyltransferase family 2 protein [Pseudolysinimonas sp.]
MTANATPATVSVAMGSRNGAAHIEEQVASILGQTLAPLELVLSDDASTDGTVEIVERVFAKHASAHPEADIRLRVLRNPIALGVAGNFAQALAACIGDVIALSDQDDVWEPERLERLVARLSAPPDVIAVHSDARLVDGQGHPLGSTLFQAIRLSGAERRAIDRGRAFDVLLRRNVATGATMVLTRSLRDAALPVPEGWIHDEWLAIIASIEGELRREDRALTGYRQHGGNEIGARKIGMSDRVDRLREPRAERNRRLLMRAESLAARYPNRDPVSSSVANRIAGKLRHERSRSALPSARWARIPSIVVATVRGDYHRYGRGLQDVLRDTVQPARDVST